MYGSENLGKTGIQNGRVRTVQHSKLIAVNIPPELNKVAGRALTVIGGKPAGTQHMKIRATDSAV